MFFFCKKQYHLALRAENEGYKLEKLTAEWSLRACLGELLAAAASPRISSCQKLPQTVQLFTQILRICNCRICKMN